MLLSPHPASFALCFSFDPLGDRLKLKWASVARAAIGRLRNGISHVSTSASSTLPGAESKTEWTGLQSTIETAPLVKATQNTICARPRA
jgi:hypothetical protein